MKKADAVLIAISIIGIIVVTAVVSGVAFDLSLIERIIHPPNTHTK
jgi:hypothetical protein